MKHIGLIVEDNADFQELIQDRIKSLNHEIHLAASQLAAREFLPQYKFSYVVLDLCVPFRTGQGIPLAENGEALLAEILAHPLQKNVPVIIWTSHGLNTHVVASRVMKNGAFNFIGKDSEALGPKLLDEIREALKSRTESDGIPPAQSASVSASEMVFYPDRIELWGIRICEGANENTLRNILDLLSQGKALGGEQLAGRCGLSGGQNTVSTTIRRFRDDLQTLFSASSSWPCPVKNILLSGGVGYRINPDIKIVNKMGSVIPAVLQKTKNAR